MQESLKISIVHCILEGNQDPSPRLHYCFWPAPSLSLASPPFPEEHLSESALWNSGNVTEAGLFGINKKTAGHRKASLCPGAPQGLAGFTPTHCLGITLSWESSRRRRTLPEVPEKTAVVGLPSDRRWPLCSPDQASTRPLTLSQWWRGVSHPCSPPPPVAVLMNPLFPSAHAVASVGRTGKFISKGITIVLLYIITGF